MGIRENKVERYLDDEIKKLGGITRKWVSPGRDGAPDRIIIIRGTVIFVEVKTVDGKLSRAQEREHNRLHNAGAVVRTVFGEAHVDTLVKWIAEYCGLVEVPKVYY